LAVTNRDPEARLPADRILSGMPFCTHDETFNFYDTELYAKIKNKADHLRR
jgi:hypothetical protein